MVIPCGCAHKNETLPIPSDINIETADTPTDAVRKATPDKPKEESKASSSSATVSDTDTASQKLKPELLIVSEDSLSMKVGDEKTISANVMPVNEEIVWSSSNEKIAVADNSGRIAALAPGDCVVTAAAKSDSSVKATINVSVTSADVSSAPTVSSTVSSQPTTIVTEQQSPESNTQQHNESNDEQTSSEKITGISISLPTTVLTVGQSATPTIELTPGNTNSTDVTLTTSDSSVVSINYDGSITANAEGACTLTVVYNEDTSVTDSVIIAVTLPEEEEPDPEDDYPTEEFYIDGILIVNKTYSLPRSYNPGGLTPECKAAFDELKQAAAADGINIWLSSGFRSYEYQSTLYNGYVSYYGQASADTFSARPGHSEHQTGLAIDCNIINDSFAGTPEAIWLAEHCHEYGFIIRYPYGKQSVTGYKYEPWHIRYIGDKATEIYESGLTLEEYYGLSSVYGG